MLVLFYLGSIALLASGFGLEVINDWGVSILAFILILIFSVAGVGGGLLFTAGDAGAFGRVSIVFGREHGTDVLGR